MPALLALLLLAATADPRRAGHNAACHPRARRVVTAEPLASP
jgi:hypothetical protein